MSFLNERSDRATGLRLFLAGAVWNHVWGFLKWFCEWIADKAFGDTAFKWLDGAMSPLLNYWLNFISTWGVTAVLVIAGLYLFSRSGPQHSPKVEEGRFAKHTGLFIAVAAVAAVFVIGAVIYWQWVEKPIAAGGIVQISSNHTVVLECDYASLPTKPPPEGYITTFRVGDRSNEFIGLSRRPAPPEGKEWNWAGVERACRCDVTNAGDKPITNLVIALSVFFQTQENEASQDIGTPDRTSKVRIPIIGSREKFVFYMYNLDKDDAGLDIPEYGYVFGTNEKPDVIRLVIGSSRSFNLPSFNIEKTPIPNKK